MESIYNVSRPQEEFWGCGIIVLNDKNEVLLGLRKDNRQWGLPGGKIELNETAIDGAAREMFEETGLKPDHLEFIEMIEGLRVLDGVTPKKDYNFICKSFSGSLQKQEEEVLDLKWVGLDKVLNEDLFICSRETLEDAAQLKFIEL